MIGTACECPQICVDYDRRTILSVLSEIRAKSIRPTERQPLLCDSPQRRAGTRVPLSVRVELLPVQRRGMRYTVKDGSTWAETIDISSGGVALLVSNPETPGEHVAIRFPLPNSDAATLLAEVKWRSAVPGGGCRIGARFLGVVR